MKLLECGSVVMHRFRRSKILLFCLICIGFIFVGESNGQNGRPDWVKSYGSNTPYPERNYLTGFSMGEIGSMDSEDPTVPVKKQAAGDLIRKIQVTIRSEITSVMEEKEDQVRSSFASINRSVATLQVEGVDYEIFRDRKKDMIYALAYLDRNKAAKLYRNRVEERWKEVEAKLEKATELEANKDNIPALKQYLGLPKILNEITEQEALLAVIEGRREQAFAELKSETHSEEGRNIAALHEKVKEKIRTLAGQSTGNLDQAIEALAYQLKLQGIEGGSLSVGELMYRDSDFSSAFGTYAARKLENELNAILSATGENTGKLLIRGTYWPIEDQVEFSIIAQRVDGNKMGSAEVRMPKATVPKEYSLTPRNFEEALKDQQALKADALVEGGINVDVWTNKGDHEDAVVFEEGDDVNLYFRVNQPAFLQLTYKLSNGAKVLLEEAYYIGMDRVNNVVRYPQTFTVAPPFGVERLIVTAYNRRPPTPKLLKQSFEGVQYDAIASSLKEYMAQTRGLVAKKGQDTEYRTGEASLTMTMVPRVK